MHQYHLYFAFYRTKSCPVFMFLVRVFCPFAFQLPQCKEFLPLAAFVTQGSGELVNFAVRETNRRKQQPRMVNHVKSSQPDLKHAKIKSNIVKHSPAQAKKSADSRQTFADNTNIKHRETTAISQVCFCQCLPIELCPA